MSSYKRYRVPGGCYFFTVNLAERRRSLLVRHIGLLRNAVRLVRRRHPFSIDAMVVLPDHVHALWTLPPGDDDFAGRWRLIKAAFSRSLTPDACDFRRHVDYIHYNPMKHGLVSRVKDWPYSSFHRFVTGGCYPEDWAGTAEGSFGGFGER
ncbi:MAG TPA: transposase [Gammaproteobacteria bacterium]|nr:transposase [Gammaproteobacteria bacterium]